MRKLAMLLAVLVVLSAFVSCSKKQPEELEEIEEVEIVETKPKEKPPVKVEKAEPAEEKPEVKEEPKPVEDKKEDTLKVSYLAYDYQGLSHKAEIKDANLVNRIMDCFNHPGDSSEMLSVTMGGTVAIVVEKNGVATSYTYAGAEDGGDALYYGNPTDSNFYYIKDETLIKELNEKYHNDNYKAQLPYSYEMSVVYGFMDYIGSMGVAYGEEARKGVTSSVDIERFKKVIESSTPYKGEAIDPENVGGELICIEVKEVRDFTSYYIFKQKDGTLLCRFSFGMSDKEVNEDKTLYVVSDTQVYDYIINNYFPGLTPQYSVKK